jgi:Helix-turn-helix domain
MAWNESTMYEQRVRFVLEVQQATFSFAESCRRYNISRTAGYTWWDRFRKSGFEGSGTDPIDPALSARHTCSDRAAHRRVA